MHNLGRLCKENKVIGEQQKRNQNPNNPNIIPIGIWLCGHSLGDKHLEAIHIQAENQRRHWATLQNTSIHWELGGQGPIDNHLAADSCVHIKVATKASATPNSWAKMVKRQA